MYIAVLIIPATWLTSTSAHSISRRQALGATAAASLALLAETKTVDAAGLATGYSLSEKDCNSQLAAYGLPKMDKVRDE